MVEAVGGGHTHAARILCVFDWRQPVAGSGGFREALAGVLGRQACCRENAEVRGSHTGALPSLTCTLRSGIRWDVPDYTHTHAAGPIGRSATHATGTSATPLFAHALNAREQRVM